LNQTTDREIEIQCACGDNPARCVDRLAAKTFDAARVGKPQMLGDDTAIWPGEVGCSVCDSLDTEPALVHQTVVTAAQ